MEWLDGQWIADSSALGRFVVAFAPKNGFGCDADAVLADLTTLKQVMESTDQESADQG